jgi:hypothetical protein
MANYIGKEPAQSPLSTSDIADGAVTAPKLATGAAVANIGYTPLDTAGGTITGNLEVDGTTTLDGTTNLNGTTNTDLLNVNDNMVVAAGKTVTLGADPTLALQAATKQYVDNNFQLATGSVQALTGDINLTSASARVFEFTEVPEFTVANLPNATTLTIANGKFVFRNEGKHVLGVKDNAGNLIGAIGPNSTATCYLYEVSTAEGKWSLVGDDVRPFFISNAGVLPQTGTTAADTLLSNAYALTIKLTETKYVVVHNDNTATNQQIVAYAVDTSTKPATVGSRTVLAALSAASGVAALAPPCIGFRITDNTCYVANASSVTSHVVLTVSGVGITVSNTIAGTFATVPFTHNPILGEISSVQRVANDLFVYAFAPSAAAIVYYGVKIDGTVIRISTTVSSPQLNGTGFAGLIDMRLISFDEGTGVGKVGVCHTQAALAPFNLFVNRVIVTRNGVGAAPTLSPVESVQVTGAAIAATANFGFAVDKGDPQFGVVYYLANTTVFPTYNGVYNLNFGTLTSTAAQIILSQAGGVATGFQRFASVANGGAVSATTAGIIGNSRGLLVDQLGDGAWRTYWITATSIRFIKISHVGITYTATPSDFALPDGTATVSGLAILGGDCSRYSDNTTTTAPGFVVLSNSAMTPAAGQLGGAKMYLVYDQANKLNLIDVFAPSTFSIRDGLPTLIGLQQMITKSGYIVVPVGSATAATTSEGSFNTWAFFKLNENGGLRYFGNWPLPIKNTREVVFNNPFNVQNNEIDICSNGIEFDQVEGIHYRKMLKIETAIDN